MIQKRITLSEAARRAGVDRATLRLWLRQDGFNMPAAGHHGRTLVFEADIEEMLVRRTIRRRAAPPARQSQHYALRSHSR